MKLPRIAWYWHVLIFIALLVLVSALGIWLDLGPSVHSMT